MATVYSLIRWLCVVQSYKHNTESTNCQTFIKNSLWLSFIELLLWLYYLIWTHLIFTFILLRLETGIFETLCICSMVRNCQNSLQIFSPNINSWLLFIVHVSLNNTKDWKKNFSFIPISSKFTWPGFHSPAHIFLYQKKIMSSINVCIFQNQRQTSSTIWVLIGERKSKDKGLRDPGDKEEWAKEPEKGQPMR